MSERKFSNIIFDTDTKTFTIAKGSVGVYSYKDIKKCNIVYEDAKYTGKSPMFDHQSIGGVGANPYYSGAKIHTGIRIILKDETILYVYISDTSTMINTLDFFAYQKQAEEVKSFINKIIEKYKEGE